MHGNQNDVAIHLIVNSAVFDICQSINHDFGQGSIQCLLKAPKSLYIRHENVKCMQRCLGFFHPCMRRLRSQLVKGQYRLMTKELERSLDQCTACDTNYLLGCIRVVQRATKLCDEISVHNLENETSILKIQKALIALLDYLDEFIWTSSLQISKFQP